MSRRLRLILLGIGAVIVHVGVFPHLRLFGVVPDIGLLVAAAVAYRLGSTTGAIMGFALGLGYDLFLETPFGLSALSWSLTAWAVGAFHSGLVTPPRVVSPILGAAAGLVGGLLFVSSGVIFGVEELRTWDSLSVVARVAVYDALVAPLVFLVVARLLPEETRLASDVW